VTLNASKDGFHPLDDDRHPTIVTGKVVPKRLGNGIPPMTTGAV
jgi:hypothetical protein